ncbi:META domain-containing protein [Shewanella maritima]|uniref:META domain-containing protein n=1 Tax=Shewanella maritima TaxID=2520507 RepID=UPI0037361D78
MIKHLALVSAAFFGLTACQSTPESTIESEISGHWHVNKVANVQVKSFSQASIEFNDGVITGNNGCNNFMGEYQLEDKQLTITTSGATRKACVNGLVQQEKRLMESLPNVVEFVLKNDVLSLKDASGKVLVELSAKQ